VQYYTSDLEHENSLRQATTSQILFEELPKIMKILSIYVGFDEKTFSKLLSVVKQELNANSGTSQFLMTAVQVCGEIFLPALALTTTNNYLEK